MDKVVYLLGAGFSAPIGLPVMGNFLEKSKDQHYADPDRFGYFWSETIFGPSPWDLYGPFAAALLGHSFHQERDPSNTNIILYKPSDSTKQEVQYSVVTLNYDLVLEMIAEFVNVHYGTSRSFHRSVGPTTTKGLTGAFLSKLHGSIDSGGIIPPTWNKTLNQQELLAEWRLAYKLLSKANHIRVIGYSLPINDNYIRYLLRTAVIRSAHLKAIDVLCWDPDGSVQQRFDEFILFRKYRFKSSRTEDYLRHHLNSFNSYGYWPDLIQFDRLEQIHQQFFSS